jgi:hypothetical protein
VNLKNHGYLEPKHLPGGGQEGLNVNGLKMGKERGARASGPRTALARISGDPVAALRCKASSTLLVCRVGNLS